MLNLRTIGILTLAALAGTACQQERAGGEAGPVQLVEGERSTPRPTEATLSFTAPAPGALSPDTVVEAGLEVEGFELGATTPGAEERGIAMSGDGQHVHFIVDDAPYVAIYDDEEVIDLSGLETGTHVLRAFPSRQWHESVKAGDAFALRTFHVGDTTSGVELDPDAPLLTYSRPKGLYRGADADSVMVDFYVTNAELGPEAHAVRLVVDDTIVHVLDEWKPYYLLGLDSGQHTVKLDLLGPDGTVVTGPFNTTERVITVARDTASGAMD